MAGSFQIFLDKAGQHRFRFHVSGQGILLASDGHGSREACLLAIEAARAHAARGKAYERKEGPRGQHGFILKGADGETIGQGGGFASVAGRDRAIRFVMDNASSAPTADVKIDLKD